MFPNHGCNAFCLVQRHLCSLNYIELKIALDSYNILYRWNSDFLTWTRLINVINITNNNNGVRLQRECRKKFRLRFKLPARINQNHTTAQFKITDSVNLDFNGNAEFEIAKCTESSTFINGYEDLRGSAKFTESSSTPFTVPVLVSIVSSHLSHFPLLYL